jgi:hypothetical protein
MMIADSKSTYAPTANPHAPKSTCSVIEAREGVCFEQGLIPCRIVSSKMWRLQALYQGTGRRDSLCSPRIDMEGRKLQRAQAFAAMRGV